MVTAEAQAEIERIQTAANMALLQGEAEDRARIERSLWPLIIPIGYVREDPKNARKHDAEQIELLKQSLVRFRQQKPISYNAETRLITAGHGIRRAALALGWRFIAALPSTLTPEQAAQYAVLDNKASDESGWDKKLLDAQLTEFMGAGVDVASLGFQEWQPLDAELDRKARAKPKRRGLKLTDREERTVERAIEKMRASQANDGKMSDGKALALICSRWFEYEKSREALQKSRPIAPH